jgi:hypothetical protein
MDPRIWIHTKVPWIRNTGFLNAYWLSGRNIKGVPSRESDSGLLYSMPTQLSYAAPNFELRRTLI